MKAINTNEGFYNSQIVRSDIKKLIFKTEENNNYFKKYKEKEKEKNREDDDDNEDNENENDNDNIDLEYKDIMEMTEEAKEEDIKKSPNVSGVIHSKYQIEKKNNLKKNEDANNCIII